MNTSMTEKGSMLTLFEECFGTTLDHEVIKAILQNVDWNYSLALEACSSMVEPANIPEDVHSKLLTLLQEPKDHIPSENSENQNKTLPRGLLLSENAGITNSSAEKDQEKNEILNHLSNEDYPLASVEHNLVKQTNVWKDSSSSMPKNRNTNLTQSASKIQEQKIYEKFLNDASYLSKSSSVPLQNKTTTFLQQRLAEQEKATCRVELVKTMLEKNDVLILMRGLPGSGKSTLAKKLVGQHGVILSSDNYFISPNGRYNFDSSKLGDAHSWNRNKAQTNINRRSNPIIIDNTNLQAWEMKSYVHMALKSGYMVEFLEPDTPWRYIPSELARRNSHGVPKKKIEEMLGRYAKNISLQNFKFPSDPGEPLSTIPKMSNHVANSYSGVSSTINGHQNANIGLCDIINNFENKASPTRNSQVINNINSCPKSSLTDCINHFKSNINSEFLNTRERSPDGPIDDEKFNDIVQTLDAEVKKHIGKAFPSVLEKTGLSTTEEDRKMYSFCEDIEDKLGNSISSLIRPQLSRGLESCSDNVASESTDVSVESAINCNIKIVKAPALDTVTEELTKDLSCSRTVLEQDSDISEGGGEDTSNDASSIELAGGDSDEPNSITKVELWQCLEPESANVDWEDTKEVDKQSKDTADQPLDVRKHRRKNEPTDSSVIMLEENATSSVAVGQTVSAEEDSWVADFKTDTWEVAEEDLDAKISKLQKTGAVPKHIREKLKPPKRQNADVTYISMSEETKSKMFYVGCPSNIKETEDAECLDTFSVSKVNQETQTELDKALKDNTLTVLHGYGQNYILGPMAELSTSGPITKDIFTLDKGTMTNAVSPQSTEGKVEDLLRFFPNLPISDLEHILHKCNGDVDWTMNILLDGGYIIEESSNESIDVDSRNKSLSPVDSDSSTPSSTSLSSGSKSKRKSRSTRKRNPKKEPLSDEASLLSDENKSSSSPVTELNCTSPVRDSSESSSHCDKLPQQVSLELDPLFAYQLVNIFGPVANLDLNHIFENSERRVNLPLSLCQEIHSHWNASLQKISKGDEQYMQDMIDYDAAFAHQLQMQEEQKKSKPFFGSFDCNEPPTNFREIMNLEKALEATKQEPKSDMAFRLSLHRLWKEFAHVDKTAVKTILQRCKGNYNDATSELLLNFGLKEGGDKDEALNTARRETDIVHQREEQLKANISKTSVEYFTDSNECERFQLEYDMYYNLRKDLLDKARCANGPHQHEVAGHYAREARKYSDKMYETKVLMSQSALEQQNKHHDVNTLDLHLLTVPAAVSACEHFLDERRRTLAADTAIGARGGRMYLTLITGWGRHSYQQKSIIKPAVKKFLQRKGYRVSEVSGNPGVLKVTL